MRNIILIVAAAVGALATSAGWATRPVGENGFTVDGLVAARGGVTVSGHVSCEVGEDVAVLVRVTQRTVKAEASTQGRCEEPLFRFTIEASPPAGSFAPGIAEVCANAKFIQTGAVVAVHQWCRPGGVKLVAAAS